MWLKDIDFPTKVILRVVRTQRNPGYPTRTEYVLVAQGYNRLADLRYAYETQQQYPDDGTRWWLEGETLP